MKFIIPKNYKLNTKLFGILDYSTAIFNLLIFILLFFILNIFIKNLKLKIFIIIITYFPIFLLSISFFYDESFIFVLYYILKFILSKKIILYTK